MRRLHTDYRKSRTTSARLPAILGSRPYLEAKAFTTTAASRIRNNFADHRCQRQLLRSARFATGPFATSGQTRVSSTNEQGRIPAFCLVIATKRSLTESI